MVGLLTERWLGNIWKSSTSRKSNTSTEPAEKQVIGILAFEVSRLMSKVVNVWLYLSDRHMSELRQEMANSIGIQTLVSEDEDYLMDLAVAEIIDNLIRSGKFVATLGKKCVDPVYHDLDSIFDDPSESDPKWEGWRYRLKKMEKRVKKMERFVAATEQLHSEMESLEELEESMRQARGVARVRGLEFQQRVFYQRQEVKNLREMSPWIRTYDYIVRLLLRSLFTIIERIKFVYGGRNDLGRYVALARCNSMPGGVQTSGYTSDNNASRGLVGRSLSNLSPSSILCGEHIRRFAPLGLSKCIRAGSDSSAAEVFTSSCGSSFRSNGAISQRDTNEIDEVSTVPISYEKVDSLFNSKRKLLNERKSSLGYAALALHYAKIILSIEKLASSPYLISLDAREDLYNMLPSTIRRCMREKVMSEYNFAFAEECSLALVRILGWLSPLAHNMMRWQSERSFERQRLIFGTNVLLVQTLHFADRKETEAVIVELLLALNYLSRSFRFRQSSCSYENVRDPIHFRT